jgi:hypothetical protein
LRRLRPFKIIAAKPRLRWSPFKRTDEIMSINAQGGGKCRPIQACAVNVELRPKTHRLKTHRLKRFKLSEEIAEDLR